MSNAIEIGARARRVGGLAASAALLLVLAGACGSGTGERKGDATATRLASASTLQSSPIRPSSLDVLDAEATATLADATRTYEHGECKVGPGGKYLDVAIYDRVQSESITFDAGAYPGAPPTVKSIVGGGSFAFSDVGANISIKYQGKLYGPVPERASEATLILAPDLTSGEFSFEAHVAEVEGADHQSRAYGPISVTFRCTKRGGG